MDYFLKANGLIILFLVFYYIVLRNDTFFHSVRVYFLIGLAATLIIPLVEVPIYVEKAVSNINYFVIDGETKNVNYSEQPFNWSQLLMLIYISGVVLLTIKFIIQLLSLSKLLRKHNIIRQDKYKLVETEEFISPFSFFNYIIYNKGQFKTEELKQIIKHEKTHVNQWHTIDTLLTYLLQIVFWFNPFAWLYKKATQQNLEFLADASANDNTSNQKQYQLTLLKACNTNYYEAMTNNFYNSLIKKRILMLNKTKSKNINYLKYSFILPALAIFIFTFNTKTIAQEKDDTESSWTVSAGLIIDKNTTDIKLKQIKSDFKKNNVNFSFKTKRNSDHEIIKINLTLKDEKGKIAWSENDSTPIQPIEVMYNPKSKEKSVKKVNTVVIGYAKTKDETEPIYIINGKEASKGKSEFISANDIKSVNVIKDKSASDKYGDKGKNGVIEINTKDAIKANFKPNTPLILLDGIIISQSEMDNLNPNAIESINVLKGLNAKARYGSKGTNGVIEIKTKTAKINKTIKNLDDDQNYQITVRDKSQSSTSEIDKNGEKIKIEGNGSLVLKNNEKPLIYIGDKEISNSDLDKVNQDDIKSINVLKGESAITKYGKKAKNGVIEITLKKE